MTGISCDKCLRNNADSPFKSSVAAMPGNRKLTCLLLGFILLPVGLVYGEIKSFTKLLLFGEKIKLEVWGQGLLL